MDTGHLDLATTTVDQCVAGELACGGDDFRLVHQGQLHPDRDCTHQLPNPDDILIGYDRKALTLVIHG
ncbi:hypothetical protein Ait01nite_098510 [Actinoplanes italicus]|nr:hypothetical protein Ait01nite_098510 [Actinoplanes italicus]